MSPRIEPKISPKRADPPGSCGRQLFGPGAIAPIVFERVGFAGRHRADQCVDLGFWQIGELFEQRGGHLFLLLRFPRPDAVDLVDQPLPRIVDENRFVVLVVDASKIDHPDRPENIEGHYADHSTDDIGPD